MAMTEEELRQLGEQMRELNGFTRFQSEAAAAAAAESKNLAREEKAAAEASARFKAKMDAASGAVGAVADVFVTYNKSVYKGASANEAAAQSMEKMGEAAKYAGAFLAILVPGGPLVKALVASLGLIAAKAAEAGAELARQTDTVYKSYQELAKAGATGAGGMQDVFDSLQKVGLGTEKFGEYLKLVNDNSKDLALFGGSVLKGRKAFEDTMGSLTREQRVQLELMGLDRTAQAEATMGYIKQQRLLTMGTKTQMDTSSTAVMKYIKETDELTRLTGLNRQEQQKALDEAMSREQFAAAITKIQREQGKDAAESAQRYHAMMYAIDPKAGRQFADSLSGFIGSSEDAQQGFMANNGKTAEIANRFMSGQITSQKQVVAAAQESAEAYAEVTQQFESQALMGNFGPTFGSYQVGLKMTTAAQNDLNANYEQAVKDAAKRNKTTEDMAKAENNARELQLFTQQLLNKRMDEFVTGLGKGQTANQEMIDYMMDSVIPALQELYRALEPLLKQLRDFVAEDVLPALTESIRQLAKFIKNILPSAEIRAVEKTAEKANEGKSFWSQVGWGADRGGRADADQIAANKALEEAYEKERAENRKQTIGFLKGLLGLEGRAAGGPVSSKTPYLVGEEGPEIFVPSIAGDIVPTGKLQGTTGAALKQRTEIEKLVDQIVVNIKEQKTISDADLKLEKEYSKFYKEFITVKTKFEKDQLEAINYQLTEGSGGAAGAGGGGGSGLKMPSMPGIAGMGGGQGIQATKQDDLSKMGLKIKTGDVQAEGAGVSPRLIELARQIQGGVPGFNYFSAFNDKFHQETASGSQHAKGLALDFTVAEKPSIEDGRQITDWLKKLGASLAIDEYNNPSSRSTAGHFHAQIPGFEEGGTLGAGRTGIAGEGGKPELISGPASITPMNDLMGALNNLNAVMERSHNTLSEIARISKATSDSSAKMLSYAQN